MPSNLIKFQGPGWLNELGSWIYLTTHTSLSPIRHVFTPGFVNYKKGCTRLAAASDKVCQLLAHGQWFSPGTPASFTTKPGCHDIAEILLKVALSTINQIKSLIKFSLQVNMHSTDFLKFVFILLDIGPATRNFLLDPLNFFQTYIFYVIVLKPSNVIPLLLYQSSRTLSVFSFISTGRGLKIGRPVTIQNKPKS